MIHLRDECLWQPCGVVFSVHEARHGIIETVSAKPLYGQCDFCCYPFGVVMSILTMRLFDRSEDYLIACVMSVANADQTTAEN